MLGEIAWRTYEEINRKIHVRIPDLIPAGIVEGNNASIFADISRKNP